MKTHYIKVYYVNDEFKIPEKLTDDIQNWTYFGSNSHIKQKIISKLSQKNRIYYSSEFNDIALNYKQHYLDWIAELAKNQNQKIWWATILSYKNPMASDHFQNFCYLLLLKKWLGNEKNNIYIFIDDIYLLKAILDNFSRQVLIKNKLKYRFRKIFQALNHYRSLIYLLYDNAKKIRLYKSIMKKEIKVKNIQNKKIDILIRSWLVDLSFSNNQFEDVYLKKLYPYLKSRDKSYLTMDFCHKILLKQNDPIDILKKQNIIFPLFLLSIKDLFISFYQSLTFRCKKSNKKIDTINLNFLLDEQNNNRKLELFDYLVYYQLCKKLIKSKFIEFDTLITVFENQPYDLMLIKAIKELNYPCKIIAYQHTTIPPLFLNFFLGKDEHKLKPQPDYILCNGEYWLEILENAGYSCHIQNGGSLRYDKIEETNKTTDSIIVLLSYDLSQSLDLLNYMNNSNLDYSFHIKPHPTTDENLYRKLIPNLGSNFTFISGNLNILLKEYKWVIHVGTSANVEALLSGSNVIKYLPEKIDLDPLLDSQYKQIIISEDKEFLLNNVQNENIHLLNFEKLNETSWDQIIKN